MFRSFAAELLVQGKRESVRAVTEMNEGFLRFEWNTGNGTTQWRTKRIYWKKGKGRWGVDHAPVCSLHPELCIEGEEEGNPFKTGLTEKAPQPPVFHWTLASFSFSEFFLPMNPKIVKRLTKELQEINQHSDYGIKAELVNNDLKDWVITFKGPDGTPYHDLQFRLSVKFTVMQILPSLQLGRLSVRNSQVQTAEQGVPPERVQ